MTLLNLKESFNLFKKNFILIIPDTVSLLISYLLLAGIFFYIGSAEIMPLIQAAEDMSLELFQNFISENLLQIIISVISFVFITFIVDVGVTTIKFDMITDLIHNKKVSLKSSFFKSRPFFWPVVLLRACIFLIFAICFALILSLSDLIYLMFNNWGSETAVIVSLSFMIPVALAVFVLLKFSLLFVYQIMFLKNIKNPFLILEDSLDLFRKSPWFVFISGLLIFGFGLVIAGASNIVCQLIGIIPGISVYLSPVWSVFQMFLSISVSVISGLYLFLQLKTKKH